MAATVRVGEACPVSGPGPVSTILQELRDKAPPDRFSLDWLLASLVAQHPQLGKQLYNEQGQLRSFVNIYVGDEDIRYLQGVETPVPDGETVSIIPAIAGG